jgi:hypothetical protein
MSFGTGEKRLVVDAICGSEWGSSAAYSTLSTEMEFLSIGWWISDEDGFWFDRDTLNNLSDLTLANLYGILCRVCDSQLLGQKHTDFLVSLCLELNDVLRKDEWYVSMFLDTEEVAK